MVRVQLGVVFAALMVMVISEAAIPPKANEYVKYFGLQRNEYGSYLKVTWSSQYNTTELPKSTFKGGDRGLSDAIYNLFAVDSSAGNDQGGYPLHRLQSDEMWNFYGGDGPIVLYLFDIDGITGAVRQWNVTIGLPTIDGMGGLQNAAVPQYYVHGQVWVGALLADGATWTLVGNSNTPAYDPRDVDFAVNNDTAIAKIHTNFPELKDLVARLTAF